MFWIITILFTFNLISNVIMVKQVFPHMVELVKSGAISRSMKAYAMFGLVLEGAASGLSFLAIYLEDDVTIAGYSYMVWLLAIYAFANANIFLWVLLFHAGRWKYAKE
ncbi:MAG: hypothetical protein ACRCU5_14175 [Rhizobiaceae bacterium]